GLCAVTLNTGGTSLATTSPSMNESKEPPPPPPVHTERRHRAPGWHSKDVARAAALVIAMYLGVQLLWYANPLVLTAFLGVLFGLAVEAGVDKLERFRIPRPAGAAMIVVTFFLLMFGIGAWLTPIVREQSVELRAKIPEAVDRIEAWLTRRQHGFFGFMFGGAKAPPATAGADTAVLARDSTQLKVADSTRAPVDTARATTPQTATETLRASLGRQLG